MFESFDVSSF